MKKVNEVLKIDVKLQAQLVADKVSDIAILAVGGAEDVDVRYTPVMSSDEYAEAQTVISASLPIECIILPSSDDEILSTEQLVSVTARAVVKGDGQGDDTERVISQLIARTYKAVQLTESKTRINGKLYPVCTIQPYFVSQTPKYTTSANAIFPITDNK